jgi:hypothetical protein
MFGFSLNRRGSRPPAPAVVARRPAAFEPLEPRQFLSATPSGLELSVTKSTVPATLLTTAKLKGAVTVSVTNDGANTETSPNTFIVYASTDGLVDATATELATLPNKKLGLKAGHTTKLTIPIKSQPVPPAGPYDILVQATDALGDVSTMISAPTTLTVQVPLAQLSAVVGTALPTAVTGGKTVKFKVVLSNSGNIPSTGALTANIGLSIDGATVLKTVTSKTEKVTVKNGGKPVTLSYSFVVPAATTPGLYFTAVTFTQGADSFTAFSSTQLTVGVA